MKYSYSGSTSVCVPLLLACVSALSGLGTTIASAFLSTVFFYLVYKISSNAHGTLLTYSAWEMIGNDWK